MVLKDQNSERTVDILATNIRGMGAVRLVESLLPSLEGVGSDRIGRVWLPDAGPLAGYGDGEGGGRYRCYRRYLPNAVSRTLECLFLGRWMAGDGSALVLGDLPIRGISRQVVFVHSPFVLAGSSGSSLSARLTGVLLRAIFRANQKFIAAAIVQTETMRSQLVAIYPGLAGKVAIVGQPAPAWLSAVAADVPSPPDARLRLFYPAASYPHKNHALIRAFAERGRSGDLVEAITLTTEAPADHAPQTMLRYLGTLDPVRVKEEYARCDALLFPSLGESYGLPLVEAMSLGLPIVAADLPYARALCGAGAIYFDPHSDESLAAAIADLARKRSLGWRPDWSAQLAMIPESWDEVARQMLAVIDAANGGTGIPSQKSPSE